MFILSQNGADPLYQQLYRQIKEQVLSGKLPPHAKLPSVRDLAAELATSRNTVEGAYQELHAEGYIYSRERSGYFVSDLDRPLAAPLSPAAGVRNRPLAAQKSYTFDFHPAGLAAGSFPVAQWRSCYLESLRRHSGALTQYEDFQGDGALRDNIREYLERSRGVACAADQIVVCSGLQQGLDMVAHLVPENRRTVAVEDPGYPLPRSVLGNNGFRVEAIPVAPTGLDPDQLTARGCSVAYVTPSHQMPMGYVMPIAQRLKLIEWADSEGNLVIEDDYDSELRYHGKPIPSLQGLRPEGNIAYLGTFSKVLSPALRLSYLVLPPSLVAPYRERFRDYFATVPLLDQKTMAEFMAQGHWERHVRRMRIVYQKKHDLLLQATERHFGTRAEVVGQGAGLHVVLRLRGRNAGEDEVIRRAETASIRLFPFSATCCAGAPEATTFMLGFGGLANPDIAPAVELLSRICF